MTLKELEDKWNYHRLSPLGKELWDSFPDGEWFYPSRDSGYMGDDPVRVHVEHMKTKIRLAMSFKHDMMTVYTEHGTTFHYVLTFNEQKILLNRYRECANKALAFKFQIAPFKENNYV
jgi:hypothetical protein